MAATESPPPTMVIAPPSVIFASVSAMAYVPCRCKAAVCGSVCS